MTPEDLLRMAKRKRPRTAFTDSRLMGEDELEPIEPLQEDILRRYEPAKKIGPLKRRGLRGVRISGGGRQGNQGTL